MGAFNSERKAVSFFKLNGKADKDNTPAFWKVEKVDGKWRPTEAFDGVSGALTKAEITSYVWEGQNRTSFKFQLSDPGEVCSVSMEHNQCSYGIINALLNVQPGQEIKIKVYRKTDKATSKIYPGTFISDISDKPIKWAIEHKDQPRGIPVMVGDKPFFKDGMQVFDKSAVQAFWEDKFRIIGDSLKAAAPAPAPATAAVGDDFPQGPPIAQTAPPVDDDLPF